MEYKKATQVQLVTFIVWADSQKGADAWGDDSASLVTDIFFSLIEHHAKHSISMDTLKDMLYQGLEHIDADYLSSFIICGKFPIETDHIIDTWFDKYTDSKT